jgi:hypothetical protein
MAVYTRRYLVEGIVDADFVFSFGLLWGETLDLCFSDQMMSVFSMSLTPMGVLL